MTLACSFNEPVRLAHLVALDLRINPIFRTSIHHKLNDYIGDATDALKQLPDLLWSESQFFSSLHNSNAAGFANRQTLASLWHFRLFCPCQNRVPINAMEVDLLELAKRCDLLPTPCFNHP
jgi:hypothetical protein